MILGNPWGLLALLGLPAVLAIHMLQRKPRRQRSSTLFLLAAAAPKNSGGPTLDRLRRSLSLWLNLLAVLLLSAVLAQPRILTERPVLRGIVVLDSSVSMMACRQEVKKALEKRLGALASLADCEWSLLESAPEAPLLYGGGRLESLLSALDSWKPVRAEHDPAPALRSALAAAGKDGCVLFVSDHKRSLPAGTREILVGTPIANAGFCGAGVDPQGRWQALLRNYSDAPLTSSWRRQVPGAPEAAASQILLAPNETRRLEGEMPKEGRLLLILDKDALEADNQLPLLTPRPKILKVALDADKANLEFLSRLRDSLPLVESSDDIATADLVLGCRASDLPRDRPGLYFNPAASIDNKSREVGDALHPMTSHLDWRPVRVRLASLPFKMESGDLPLLWSGDSLAASLRYGSSGPQILINAAPAAGRLLETPACLVLAGRLVEEIRRRKQAPEAANFDCNQKIALPYHGALALDGQELKAGRSLRAPELPAFFSVSCEGREVLTGAAAFADARESDLRRNVSLDGSGDLEARLIQRSRQEEPIHLPGLLIALLCFVLGWAVKSRDGN
jgi:hypothetical protein